MLEKKLISKKGAQYLFCQRGRKLSDEDAGSLKGTVSGNIVTALGMWAQTEEAHFERNKIDDLSRVLPVP